MSTPKHYVALHIFGFMALKKQQNTRHQIVWLLKYLQRGDTDLENLFT